MVSDGVWWLLVTTLLCGLPGYMDMPVQVRFAMISTLPGSSVVW